MRNMRKRTGISFAVAVAVIAALLVAVYLRKNAPPEVARLLPEADAIVYVNLEPFRTATHFDRHPAPRDPDYQAFIDATGIDLERDLDAAAFAIHRMTDPTGPNGPVAYSEVFSVRFNGPRLTAYLASKAASIEQYAGHPIYSIPHQGRTVRVVLLGYDLVAVSNTPTTEQIHSILDRYHTAALPFSGNSLLAQHYSDVPLLSQAWGIGKLGLPFASGQHFQAYGVSLPVPVDATFIASVRFLGSLRLRLEEIAPSEDMAKMSAGMANVALGLLRSTSVSVPSSEQNATSEGWKQFVQSATVSQKGDRAILKATVPLSLVRSLVATPQGTAAQPLVDGPPPAP